jgi:hypothetical protein
VGFILSALSIAAGIAAIVLKLSGALEVPGWTSMIFAITFLGGVQLLTIGVMGEYVSRIHDEVRGRPLYLVQDTVGIGQAVPGPRDGTRGHAVALHEDPSQPLSPVPPDE